MRVDIITSIMVVIVKFKLSDFHKCGRNYKTCNRSKAHYINTHSSSSNESKFHYFTEKKKLEFLSLKERN